MPVTIEDVCRSAWESTRSESSVAYDDLTADYRDRLTQRAEGVLSGIYPSEPWLAFETQVCQLADGRGNMQVGSESPIPEEVKEELVEETVVPLEPKGHLPADFPALDILHEAGINTYTQLSKVDDLTEIAGIGPVLAKKILRQLRADRKALNQ